MAKDEEEHSEFDDEDEHEHTADCGHSEEQHARMERVQKNFEKFLADSAADLMEPDMYEKLQKKVEKNFRKIECTMSYQNLKIFREGFEFGFMTQMQVPNELPKILAAVQKMVQDREKKRPIIDITKSKPLPPNEEKA